MICLKYLVLNYCFLDHAIQITGVDKQKQTVFYADVALIYSALNVQFKFHVGHKHLFGNKNQKAVQNAYMTQLETNSKKCLDLN